MTMEAYDAFLATAAERFDALDTDAPAKARSAVTVPASQLGHLAWSRGLDYWDQNWSESTKRELTKQTPANLRRRGTREAIDVALTAFAADLTIEEWHEQDPEGPPGTASATVALGAQLGSSADDQALVLRLLSRESRKSIHWTLVLGVGGSDAIAAAGRARVTVLYQYTGTQVGA